MSTRASTTLDALLAGERTRSALIALATADLPQQHTTATTLDAVRYAFEEMLLSTYYSAVPETDFTLDGAEKIGSGGYANVLAPSVTVDAEKLKEDTAYAFKRFLPLEFSEDLVRPLQLEVAVGRCLSVCPSIHRTVGGFMSEACSGILMHRADESLRDVARHFADLERKGSLTEEQRGVYYVFVARAALCVVTALEHMHHVNMIHGDVKPANIFVTRGAGDDSFPTVTLGDFGSVQLVKDARQIQEVEVLTATPFYAAPQSISGSFEKETVQKEKTLTTILHLLPTVSSASDVWSLGVTLLEMANFGENPFVKVFGSHNKFVERFTPFLTGRVNAESASDEYAFNFKLPPTCPAPLILLAQKCLVLDAKDRCSLSEARTDLEQFLKADSVSAGVATAPADEAATTGYTVNVAGTQRLASTVVPDRGAPISPEENMKQQFRNELNLSEEPAGSLQPDTTNADSLSQPADAEEDADRAYRRRLVDVMAPRVDGRVWVDDEGEIHFDAREPEPTPEPSTRPHTPNGRAPVHGTEMNNQQRIIDLRFGGEDTGTVHQSNGSANGRRLFTGPRGGVYYVNPRGNKTYIRKNPPVA